jgi:hypothetical protein
MPNGGPARKQWHHKLVLLVGMTLCPDRPDVALIQSTFDVFASGLLAICNLQSPRLLRLRCHGRRNSMPGDRHRS